MNEVPKIQNREIESSANNRKKPRKLRNNQACHGNPWEGVLHPTKKNRML
jgi:hypothetical protein